MVMAGLWAKWKDPKSGDEIQSCTILTTISNGVMGKLHNRMPVILVKEDWASGWAKSQRPARNYWRCSSLARMQILKIWPVDTKVGNVRNKGAELVLPI